MLSIDLVSSPSHRLASEAPRSSWIHRSELLDEIRQEPRGQAPSLHSELCTSNLRDLHGCLDRYPPSGPHRSDEAEVFSSPGDHPKLVGVFPFDGIVTPGAPTRVLILRTPYLRCVRRLWAVMKSLTIKFATEPGILTIKHCARLTPYQLALTLSDERCITVWTILSFRRPYAGGSSTECIRAPGIVC
jgi:hypothetical protein